MKKYIPCKNLDKIGEIALYYGFTAKESIAVKKTDLDHAKSLLEGDYIDKNHLPLHVEEKVALLRTYAEENMHNLSQPVMLYFKEPFKGSIKKNSTYNRYSDLEIIGNSKSIAEVTLIQTAKMMLKEEGYENVYVDINSIGDKDSIARFSRELINYYRKHINDMHTDCRELLKKDPFELLGCDNEKCMKINSEAPKAMDFLGEPSRVHFQEILEYLEALQIPYRINNNLIGNKKYCTETIFTIMDAKDDNILAVGVRYDGLAKKIGMKKEVQGVGISLLIKGNKPELRKELNKTRVPIASFMQIGFESKLLSFSVIESLRQIKLPLNLSLSKDRLGAQASVVSKNHVPYYLIMGKKEAIDRTVIIRDTSTHEQEIVPLEKLATYMKKLKL